MCNWALDIPLVDFKNATHGLWSFFQQKIFCFNYIVFGDKIKIMIFEKTKTKKTK